VKIKYEKEKYFWILYFKETLKLKSFWFLYNFNQIFFFFRFNFFLEYLQKTITSREKGLQTTNKRYKYDALVSNLPRQRCHFDFFHFEYSIGLFFRRNTRESMFPGSLCPNEGKTAIESSWVAWLWSEWENLIENFWSFYSKRNEIAIKYNKTIRDLKQERKIRRKKTLKTICLLSDVNKFIKCGSRIDDELFSLNKTIFSQRWFILKIIL
jgi:hypothetical protein